MRTVNTVPPREIILGASVSFYMVRCMVYVIVNNGRVCVTLQRSVLSGNELMFFADICAGPGGFTECMLYRTRWHAKGYGFTLKSEQCFHVCTVCMCIHSCILMNFI